MKLIISFGFPLSYIQGLVTDKIIFPYREDFFF